LKAGNLPNAFEEFQFEKLISETLALVFNLCIVTRIFFTLVKGTRSLKPVPADSETRAGFEILSS